MNLDRFRIDTYRNATDNVQIKVTNLETGKNVTRYVLANQSQIKAIKEMREEVDNAI